MRARLSLVTQPSFFLGGGGARAGAEGKKERLVTIARFL